MERSPPSDVVVHWDGKLLPTLSVKELYVEWLPIVTSKNLEQLRKESKLENSTG